MKGHVWGGGGGTAIMKIILGLTGQVVGGGFICNGHNGVKGHVWGEEGGLQS